MEYKELGVTTRINAVKTRRRDLENQYLQLQLRLEAPDAGMPVNEMDKQNLETLEASLATLDQMQKDLEAEQKAQASKDR